MSTMHKFKAYFGMVPLEDYEDDYLDDPGPPRRAPRPSYGELDDLEYAEPAAPRPSYAGRREEFEDGYDAPRRAPRLEPIGTRTARPGPAASVRGTTRGALAMDTGVDERIDTRRPSLFDEGGTLSKITTLRPRDYSEARTIGERFRDGTPVIMDLVEMSNADAKRLVDFAAGLAFALRGSFDKVATKVFLLSPADIDVSAEERRRIAETGFYNQK
ncbi:cell division protein SepF [Antrihabitans cavernicola]|uniref:Cell division protein SepF n=1 Tax=Antrihabitans cavernicola TaxID=2495913 RepID=A0A5A7SB43_9NOCA|nr:cell division protein SepF [Spelaeibacter cavernicola]KAA0023146.1 cell division protein SepF [Spelaeibacter cavernicola]